MTAEGTTGVTGTVGDLAGNQASATATVRLDRTLPVIGAVIIPISFLSAFQSSSGWSGILVLLAFTPIGLAMTGRHAVRAWVVAAAVIIGSR